MSTLNQSPYHFYWVGRKHLMASSQPVLAKQYPVCLEGIWMFHFPGESAFPSFPTAAGTTQITERGKLVQQSYFPESSQFLQALITAKSSS